MHRHRAVLLIGLAVLAISAGALRASASDFSKATELMDEGWLDDAEKILNNLVANDPDNAELYYLLARLNLAVDPD